MMTEVVGELGSARFTWGHVGGLGAREAEVSLTGGACAF